MSEACSGNIDYLYIKENDADTDLGTGTIWIEFIGEWATRQCERYGERWVCSLGESCPGIGGKLCNQPRSEMDELGDESEIITREEFERAWDKAVEEYQNWPKEEIHAIRFYKIVSEEGIGYIKFKGQKAIRQSVWYNNRWFCSAYERTSTGRSIIVESSLNSLFQSGDLSAKNEISEAEFEEGWAASLKYYQTLES